MVTVVEDEYTCMVRLVEDDSKCVKLDQTHLETVIPAIGKSVLVVNGAYRSAPDPS